VLEALEILADQPLEAYFVLQLVDDEEAPADRGLLDERARGDEAGLVEPRQRRLRVGADEEGRLRHRHLAADAGGKGLDVEVEQHARGFAPAPLYIGEGAAGQALVDRGLGLHGEEAVQHVGRPAAENIGDRGDGIHRLLPDGRIRGGEDLVDPHPNPALRGKGRHRAGSDRILGAGEEIDQLTRGLAVVGSGNQLLRRHARRDITVVRGGLWGEVGGRAARLRRRRLPLEGLTGGDDDHRSDDPHGGRPGQRLRVVDRDLGGNWLRDGHRLRRLDGLGVRRRRVRCRRVRCRRLRRRLDRLVSSGHRLRQVHTGGFGRGRFRRLLFPGRERLRNRLRCGRGRRRHLGLEGSGGWDDGRLGRFGRRRHDRDIHLRRLGGGAERIATRRGDLVVGHAAEDEGRALGLRFGGGVGRCFDRHGLRRHEVDRRGVFGFDRCRGNDDQLRRTLLALEQAAKDTARGRGGRRRDDDDRLRLRFRGPGAVGRHEGDDGHGGEEDQALHGVASRRRMAMRRFSAAFGSLGFFRSRSA
jgi:hypothetical protein